METKDLEALVLNSIRDAKVIVDNYDYFKEQNPDGLWKDHNAASQYLCAFETYYSKGSKAAVNAIHETLVRYYVPYVETFTGENKAMGKARRFGFIAIQGMAAGLLLSAVDKNFLYCTIPLGIMAFSSFGYIRSMGRSRGDFLEQFAKLDAEAKAISVDKLESFLESGKDKIHASLSIDHSYQKS